WRPGYHRGAARGQLLACRGLPPGLLCAAPRPGLLRLRGGPQGGEISQDVCPVPQSLTEMACMRAPVHAAMPRLGASVRAWCWSLLLALVLAPALGQMHRALHGAHGPAPAVLQANAPDLANTAQAYADLPAA